MLNHKPFQFLLHRFRSLWRMLRADYKQRFTYFHFSYMFLHIEALHSEGNEKPLTTYRTASGEIRS